MLRAFFFGLILALPLVWFFRLQETEEVAAWWDDAWHYRQRVDVTNNTSEETDVYVALTLDTSDTTKFQADCGDLRFTRQNGKLLEYYISFGCGTASTSVHVQFDAFPAGAQSVYAYYGNGAAQDGFASADFSTEASSYTIGGVASEEVGPGAIAFWKFDEGSGTTANDSAGDNQGTIDGATWASEDQCVSGKCLSFDGVDDRVNPNNDAVMDIRNTPLTYSAWIKTSNSSGVIIERGGSSYGVQTAINSNVAEFSYRWGGSNITTITGITSINDSGWHHVVGVIDASGNMTLYVDGKSENTGSATLMSTNPYDGMSIGHPDDLTGSTSPVNISVGLSGLIDEVKIFPYALSEDQIKTEYNLGAAAVMGTGPLVTLPPNGTLKDSLVAHWSFDEQAGQTVHDKVGGNDGTRGADANAGSDDPTWKPASECKVNGCASFDGGDYVRATSSERIDANFSVSLWANPSSYSGVPQLLTTRMAGYTFDMALTASTIHGDIGNGSSWLTTSADATHTVPLGQWTHIVYSVTPTGYTIYANGKQVGSATYGSDTPLLVKASGYIDISGVSSQQYVGLIDEVKIYNTALTADQVRQDMNAGASVSYSVGQDEADDLTDGAGDPPVAEWRFDEKQGATAYDTSGNENNGTVNGATWKSAARCHQGACLEFDGSGDYFKAPSLTGRSISMWVYIDSIQSGSSYLLDARTGGSDSYYYNNSVGPFWTTQYVNGVETSVSYSAIPKDQWAHVYLEGSTSFTDDINFMSRYNDSEFMSGKIDHVKIYDYARTPAQIAYDYNRGKSIAHWKFDECEGTVAHDSSGNDNHGTINIGASGSQTTAGTCETSGAWGNGAEGKFNGSLNFDGTDDYVDLGDNFDIRANDMSVSAWVRTTDTSFNIISKSFYGNNPGRWYLLYLGGKVQAGLSTSGGGKVAEWMTISILDNQWHHIMATWNRDENLSLYVDGVKKDEVDISAGDGEDYNTDFHTFVARYNDEIDGTNPHSTALKLDGQIDDVRIYNYALSPAQVQKVMNEGMAVRYGPVLGVQ